MLGSLQLMWHQGSDPELHFSCAFPFKNLTSGVFCYLSFPFLTTPAVGFAHGWTTFPPSLPLAGRSTPAQGQDAHCGPWATSSLLAPAPLSWGSCEFVRFDFAHSNSQINLICLQTQVYLLSAGKRCCEIALSATAPLAPAPLSLPRRVPRARRGWQP